jgi:hypothetical protein
MDKYTIELNAARKDSDFFQNPKLNAKSPIVEVFTAMAEGKTLPNLGKNTDESVRRIKELGAKSAAGDFSAMAELNAIRRYAIEPLVDEELRLMQIFGDFEQIAAGDSIEREVYGTTGQAARFQAPNGDVPFAVPTVSKYPVAPQTISGGYVVDYRKVALGDMNSENRGLQQVRIDIMNKASNYVLKTVYAAIKNATGVKYFAEEAGIAAANFDPVLTKVRRHGVPTILGSYANVSQLDPSVIVSSTGTVLIMSERALEEIRRTGYLGYYKGAIVREIPYMPIYGELNATGDDFASAYPEGLVLITPTGLNSPIKTWVRGGLTSLTGNDIATGHVMTRFDIEVAADVAKGHEFKIGLYNNTTLSPAAGYAL